MKKEEKSPADRSHEVILFFTAIVLILNLIILAMIWMFARGGPPEEKTTTAHETTAAISEEQGSGLRITLTVTSSNGWSSTEPQTNEYVYDNVKAGDVLYDSYWLGTFTVEAVNEGEKCVRIRKGADDTHVMTLGETLKFQTDTTGEGQTIYINLDVVKGKTEKTTEETK